MKTIYSTDTVRITLGKELKPAGIGKKSMFAKVCDPFRKKWYYFTPSLTLNSAEFGFKYMAKYII